MDSLSQAEVGSALQVYFNLGQLRQVRVSPCGPMLAWSKLLAVSGVTGQAVEQDDARAAITAVLRWLAGLCLTWARPLIQPRLQVEPLVENWLCTLTMENLSVLS